jgi:hypothetical protein
LTHHRQHWGVVDVNGRLANSPQRAGKTHPFAIGDVAHADFVDIHRGLNRENALDDLLCLHLQGKDPNRPPVQYRGRMRDAERERGFAEARPGGHDDQVRALKSSGELVELREPRWYTNEGAAVLLQDVELVKQLFDDLLDLHELRRRPALGDVENRPLSEVEGILHLEIVAESESDDRCAGVDQPAHGRGALDNPGVILDVNRRWHDVDEGRQIGESADLIELIAPSELVGEGEHVGRVAAGQYVANPPKKPSGGGGI